MNKLLRKKTNELQKKKKKGFTLVELIIVIAIIAILAAIAIPKFGEVRENSAKRTDLATAKNISTAIATEIANGGTNVALNDSNKAVPAAILNKLDGDKTAKSSTAPSADKSFHYSIDGTGNISIFYSDGTTRVYPAS